MTSDSVPTDRRWLLAAAGLLAIHAALAWWLRAPAVSTGHDDAIYLLLGRDLLHGSYRNFWLVGAPAHGLYPPLYPAALAVTGASGERGFPIAVLLDLALSVGSLATFTAMVWPWSRPVAVLSLAVIATNPMLVQFAGEVRSEPLFDLALIATLAASVRPSPRAAVAAGAFAIAAALARSVGVTVIAGLMVLWLLERRWRRALILLAASVLLVGSWLAWSATAPGRRPGESYWGDLVHDQRPPAVGEPVDWPVKPALVPVVGNERSAGTTEPPPPRGRPLRGPANVVAERLGARLLYHLRAYPQALADVFSIPGVPGTNLDNIAGFVIGLGLGLAGLVELRRRVPLAIIAGAAYTVVLIAWPYLVVRFLVPLVPLVVLAPMVGAKRLTARAKGPLALAGPIGLAGLLLLGHVGGLRRAVRAEAGCDRARPVESGCFSPESRGYLEAVTLAGRTTPPGAVFLTPKPATLYYLIGRRSVNELAAAALDAPKLAEFLDRNRVGYVLLSRIHLDQLAIGAGMQDLCAGWTVLGSFDEGGTVLLGRPASDRPAGDPPTDACAAIAAWRARAT